VEVVELLPADVKAPEVAPAEVVTG
jgi:hypothetical protein